MLEPNSATSELPRRTRPKRSILSIAVMMLFALAATTTMVVGDAALNPAPADADFKAILTVLLTPECEGDKRNGDCFQWSIDNPTTVKSRRTSGGFLEQKRCYYTLEVKWRAIVLTFKDGRLVKHSQYFTDPSFRTTQEFRIGCLDGNRFSGQPFFLPVVDGLIV